MARPRKPTTMHLMEGTYRADRHGDIAGKIVPVGQPFKPSDLSPVASEFWDEVANELAKNGVATLIDTTALVEACKWYARYRKSSDVVDKMKPRSKAYNKLLNQAVACWKEFEKCLAKFGLTPADRAKFRFEQRDQRPDGIAVRKRA